jgi:uncharacterized protein YecT (DUF1311 family)
MTRAHDSMKQIIWTMSVWLALGCSVHAASFDCAKAHAPIEIQICTNAALSKLDEEMSSVYRRAMAYVIDPVTLKTEHGQWLKVRDQSSDKELIIQQYQERILSIQAEINRTKSEPYYRYKLEYSQDKTLCLHMTKVFNAKFKTPWYKSWLKLEPDPIFFGVPYSQHFEKLPGITYDKRSTFDMLLAKYPTSAEFEAVKWLEGRYHDDINSYQNNWPILLAQVDIDNDGEVEWVIKNNFIKNGDHTRGSERDRLSIYRKDDFKIADQISLSALYYGQNAKPLPKKLDTAMQLRPFMFNEITYISAYEANGGTFDQTTFEGNPEKEYMNIWRLTGKSELFGKQSSETLEKTTVCRIRMYNIH